jgi:hypothetical protein
VQKKFFEFFLTSNPGIPEYRDLAFRLRIPTLYRKLAVCTLPTDMNNAQLVTASNPQAFIY